MITRMLVLYFLMFTVHISAYERNRHNHSYQSPLLYSLLKQKLEVKIEKTSSLVNISRQIVSIMLALGCGVFGATVLDYYLAGAPSKKIKIVAWLLEKFGTTIEDSIGTDVSIKNAGIVAEGALRLRTPQELKKMAIGAAGKAVAITQETLPEMKKRTLFKPLFCLTTIASYFICRYLLREQPRPYYDVLYAFVVDWKMHSVRTPKEFHHFFDKQYKTYREHDDLLMSEETAMTVVRQITTLCTSNIIDELGIDDTDANRLNLDKQRDVEHGDKESIWLGWQILPTVCKLLGYFF